MTKRQKRSEAAVDAALKWLAAHQHPDGSWNFDHTRGPCAGRCSHAGTIREATRAATAMALLPMLGAGHTHMQGAYQATVKGGLNYLVYSMSVRGGTGALDDRDGRMYAHGLCTIVLCEAYAMTGDPARKHDGDRASVPHAPRLETRPPRPHGRSGLSFGHRTLTRPDVLQLLRHAGDAAL